MSKRFRRSNLRSKNGPRDNRVPAALGSYRAARDESQTILAHFREVIILTFPDSSTTVTSYDLSADNLGDRMLGLSDQYSLCRIKSLRLTTYTDFGNRDTSGGGDSHGDYALSLNGPITTGAVSALDQMVDAPIFNVGTLAQPSKVQTVVPPEFFSGRNYRWFYTRDQGDDGEWKICRLTLLAHALFTASVNNSLYCIIEGEMVFRNPIDPDLNPRPGNKRHSIMPSLSEETKESSNRTRNGSGDDDSAQTTARHGSERGDTPPSGLVEGLGVYHHPVITPALAKPQLGKILVPKRNIEHYRT